jgi:tRNA pseudouridine55 synthase
MKNPEPWQDVDGLLVLDKPLGISSNRALQTARRIYRARKAGHAGTLDPLATGLLLVCFGRATRVASYLLNLDKVYRARLKLGVTTTTADAEGEVLERRPVPALESTQLHAVLARFEGEIDQLPPMYSALKQQGQPLYKLARKGVKVERKPRRLKVYRLQLMAVEDDTLEIEVHCSKGLYVRTLAEDIGASLGCGAHLSALRRLAAGPYGVSPPMVGLEELSRLGPEALPSQLMPVDRALGEFPSLALAGDEARAFCQGQSIQADSHPCGQILRCYGPDVEFLGLGEMQSGGRLAPKMVLA